MSDTYTIYTVGYEGRTVNQVIDILKEADVELLVDARYRAHSRKAGFSKSRLKQALNEEHINYEHRKELGTPSELMQKLRETGAYELDEYASYLDENQYLITNAAEELKGLKFALLCYEKNATECHRSIVANRIAKVLNCGIKHL